MTHHTYQVLRLVQACCALIGVVVSTCNSREAILDRRWLRKNGLNGLREMTATSMIYHETGRTLMQVFLFIIGILGSLSGVDDSQISGVSWIFGGQFETVLDTLVVFLVLAISVHTRHMRHKIQTYDDAHKH
jgi:hypothetical protein